LVLEYTKQYRIPWQWWFAVESVMLQCDPLTNGNERLILHPSACTEAGSGEGGGQMDKLQLRAL